MDTGPNKMEAVFLALIIESLELTFPTAEEAMGLLELKGRDRVLG